ncbi:type IV secretion system protein [Rubrivirga litoralis]|uniref:Type IV secretion system protein n=1 Tax=Rubrivirga litoralis TaxID=3075598 RepID=A0ABU3BUW6_9BACT|nr:type IV secretion system protein [Rubrivirga sp. F394]MDT0632946.1 type IV secretion system protein [Rubrivirga sp. F394]
MPLAQDLWTRLKTGRAPDAAPARPNNRAVEPRPPAVAGGDGSPPPGWAYKPGQSPSVAEGRHEFTRTFSDLAKGKRNWQLVAVFSLALLGISLVGLVTLALQSRTVPYVVEVDRLGRVEAVAPAEAVPAASDRVVIASLARFVSDIRTIYSDPVAQRDAVFRAYSYIAGDARDFLEGYFSDPQNDPRALAAELRRSVEIVSVLPIPTGSDDEDRVYRVRWNEAEVSTRGGTRERAWEGYMTVEVQPPVTTEGIQRNPLGVFVTDLSWSALAGNGVLEDPGFAPSPDAPPADGLPADAPGGRVPAGPTAAAPAPPDSL